ncbi:hypothetical protein HYU95_01235 [Candidatus Daviesbacteria bacterium]|nr:hypothetical protein [Candidatus Daviesbacteria bacterium]
MNKIKDNQLYFQKKCRIEDLLKGKKTVIGIHGLIGSFTDEALYRLAHEELGIKTEQYLIKELVHAENVIKSVVSGKTDRGIFAVANSGSGAYLASVEAMAKYNFKILAVFTMPINMSILSHPQITSIKEINLFRGHPVAIAQCRRTLKKRWPRIPVSPDTDELDTALSAKLLKVGKIEKKTAVFASKRAADIYGLNILVEGAHDDPLNSTSFVVIKK